MLHVYFLFFIRNGFIFFLRLGVEYIELAGLFLVCLLRFNEILEEAANVMEVNYMGWKGLGMVVGSL